MIKDIRPFQFFPIFANLSLISRTLSWLILGRRFPHHSRKIEENESIMPEKSPPSNSAHSPHSPHSRYSPYSPHSTHSTHSSNLGSPARMKHPCPRLPLLLEQSHRDRPKISVLHKVRNWVFFPIKRPVTLPSEAAIYASPSKRQSV